MSRAPNLLGAILSLLGGRGVKGSFASVKARLDDVDTTLGGLAPGLNGEMWLPFGPDDSSVATVTGQVYGPVMVLRDIDILGGCRVTNRDQQGIGDAGAGIDGVTYFDVERSAAGTGGPWNTIYSNGGKPQIAASTSDGAETVVPGITGLLAGAALRMKILGAPTQGANPTYVAAGFGNSGSGSSVTSKAIPAVAGVAAGDQLVCHLYSPAQLTAIAATGWTLVRDAVGNTDYLAGDDTTNKHYLYVLKRIADGTSGDTATVTWTGGTAISIISRAFRNGVLVTPLNANCTVQASGVTSQISKSGLTTPVANCIVSHVIGTRTVATTSTPSIGADKPTWDGGDPADVVSWNTTQDGTTGSETVRVSSLNLGLGATHESQAGAGAITQRTASWTNSARAIIATLVIQPTASQVPKGSLLWLPIRPH